MDDWPAHLPTAKLPLMGRAARLVSQQTPMPLSAWRPRRFESTVLLSVSTYD